MKKIMIILFFLLLIACTSQEQQTQQAQSSTVLALQNGETVDLTAEIIQKEVGGTKYRMYGYNGLIPGPLFKVQKNTSVNINFYNNIDQPTTVHWHGLRHDIKDDGVPGISQEEVQPGESYGYTVYFPDTGIFWYHPHVREDLQQDLGLYGNMLVQETEYFNQVNREEALVLDDILIGETGLVPFGKEYATHALMGRFGNVMLINGDPGYILSIESGEVVRFYVTNVANARPFNLKIPGAKIKLVGSDLGKYEREQFVEEVTIAPAERYIIEVYFENTGLYTIVNENPAGTTNIGSIQVAEERAQTDYSEAFLQLKENKEIIDEISTFRKYFDKPVDYELELTLDVGTMMMDTGHTMMMSSDHEGGMPMGMSMKGDIEPIEWEDDMGMMNAMSTSENIRWVLKDKATGKENMDIKYNTKVGDKMKIRLFNNPNSMHPMQHPIHLHGQRFLVISTDGVPNDNLVWKDTVLVPTGSTVDILVDVTNPGEWMVHCHIAEHLTAGMMTSMIVEGR